MLDAASVLLYVKDTLFSLHGMMRVSMDIAVCPKLPYCASQLGCIACLTLVSHDLQAKIVPESILQTCIKISNEPPSDMRSNMRRAFAAFNQEMCNRYPVLPPTRCTAPSVLPDKAFVFKPIKTS